MTEYKPWLGTAQDEVVALPRNLVGSAIVVSRYWNVSLARQLACQSIVPLLLFKICAL